MYAPDSAIREITALLNEYEKSAVKYRETHAKSSVLADDGEKAKKRKGK